jgi:hypothetical protein
MKPLLTAVLLTIALALSACTSTDVADNAEAANALLDLRQEYQLVRDDLASQIDGLPTETGVALLDLAQATDAYVARLETAWQAGLTPDQLDRLYMEGRSLYLRGEALLMPLVDTLPPQTWALLGRFSQQAQAVDNLYLRIKSGDPQTRELIRAGLALATLALRVGMMTL